MLYDLLLRGGYVLDPANNRNGKADIAIGEGKIALVAEKIPPDAATRTVDVEGFLVMPGLLDIHVHAYGGYEGWLFPDLPALSNGVTTVVDAGGSGWKSFDHFRNTIINRSKTRVLAFLNIVGAGMLGAVEQDVSEMEPLPCAETIQNHRDVLVGVKTAHFAGPGWEAVDRALEAAELSHTPLMVDFAPRPTRSYRDLLLKHLRSGDIHTHLYAQHIPLLDENRHIQDYVLEARSRGVLFDLGHGAGSFWWRIAVPAVRQGFPPDTISTDLHKVSALLPDASMTTTMSKCLALGMSLEEVIRRSTVEPARAIRRPELGTLSVGAEADIAVMKIVEGNFGFVDSGRARMQGKQRLECALTLRAGQIVWDRNGISRPDWESAGDYVFLS